MIVRGSFLLLLLGLCLLVLGQPSSFFGSHNLFYRGPDSIIYGPFPQEQVFQWYDAGYFDAALEVSYQEDQPFFPLRDLLALPNSAAPDAFELPHENSKLTTQNIQNKPKSLPSPKRALKFLKKRAGKLLSKSKQLLTKSHDDFDTGRSHLPIALHDSTSNQIVEDDTYEEMEELSAIESEEEKFLQKNSNPNPPLSSQKSSKKGIFEFSKARKISVKSLGVGDRGLWDNENAADSVVLDVGSSRFSEWIEQFQTFLKTTVNRGPRVFVLSLLTCVQYGFLITAYFYFEQTKLTEFFTAASNPNSDLGVNWRHFAALMQTSWWRDTNWPIIISQWLGENRDWLVVSFLIGGFLATNVARNKMSTQREAESRPVLNADSLILCIGHIWLLLRNCKVSWLTIIFSLPVLYTMFVRHKVLSRSHNDLFSNYLAQDIAVSRNRLQYYGRLLKNNESTRRLKKSRLLDVLQRLEIQEIESLRKKELTLMSHLSSLQAVSGISHVVFAFLLIVNIVCIPRVIPHIAPLIPNNVFESIVEVVRKVLRTSLPLVPIHQDVQRSSSLIQLLVLSVFIPLLKWVQVIESKTSQPLLRKDSERSTIPNYGADLFSSLDKSQGLKLTNWICKLKHGDDSTLLTCSEEFVPGKVSLLHVPTAEDVVVLDSLFQHICGVQQSNLLIEGELSLHGSTLMLNDKLLDKTDFLCYIGNEGKLCSQAGILSGFSLQKDFNMVRYKAALESSKSQWIFSQLPFGASTFISPPELKGILHIDDYALLGEEEWARLALCRTLTRLSNNDVLVYISLPLCNFTTSEEEEIINFINSILLPHQVAVVTTRNSRSDLSTKSSNHFEMSNQHLEKVHEYQLSASEITVDDQNINIGIQFQDEDYLKDWQ